MFELVESVRRYVLGNALPGGILFRYTFLFFFLQNFVPLPGILGAHNGLVVLNQLISLRIVVLA